VNPANVEFIDTYSIRRQDQKRMLGDEGMGEKNSRLPDSAITLYGIIYENDHFHSSLRPLHAVGGNAKSMNNTPLFACYSSELIWNMHPSFALHTCWRSFHIFILIALSPKC
jgi:hypothetical protein